MLVYFSAPFEIMYLQLQLLANEDPSSQLNFAVVEFKNSEAAEQCVIENNGTEVNDGILQLTYALPGYSGVDFVCLWNKPTNIHFKRSQVTLKDESCRMSLAARKAPYDTSENS